LAVKIPTYLVVGTEDVLDCKGVLASDCSSAESLHRYEAPYFGPAARLVTAVLRGSGHDLNFAANAREYESALFRWADSVTTARLKKSRLLTTLLRGASGIPNRVAPRAGPAGDGSAPI